MHKLAIIDGYHGQGIGEQVIDWALVQTKKRGRTILRLDCENSNTNLCEYYIKLGFTKIGTKLSPLNTDYNAALFEKSIAHI